MSFKNNVDRRSKRTRESLEDLRNHVVHGFSSERPIWIHAGPTVGKTTFKKIYHGSHMLTKAGKVQFVVIDTDDILFKRLVGLENAEFFRSNLAVAPWMASRDKPLGRLWEALTVAALVITEAIVAKLLREKSYKPVVLTNLHNTDYAPKTYYEAFSFFRSAEELVRIFDQRNQDAGRKGKLSIDAAKSWISSWRKGHDSYNAVWEIGPGDDSLQYLADFFEDLPILDKNEFTPPDLGMKALLESRGEYYDGSTGWENHYTRRAEKIYQRLFDKWSYEQIGSGGVMEPLIYFPRSSDGDVKE